MIIQLPLIRTEKNAGYLRIEFSEEDRPAQIFVLEGPEFLKSQYIGTDYFYALRSLRLDLEKNGYFLACIGSLESVYPSGMSADMSNGLIAYKVAKGSLVKVRIFDTVPIEQYQYLATVDRQKELRRRLIRSGQIRKMSV